MENYFNFIFSLFFLIYKEFIIYKIISSDKKCYITTKLKGKLPNYK